MIQRIPKLAAAAVGLATLLGPAAGWAGPAETFGIPGPSQPSLKPARLTPSEAAGLDLGRVPEVRLQALDADALLREDAAVQRQGRAKGLRYGVGRDLLLAAGDGHRYDLAGDGRLWVGEIVSTGALGLRLHFRDVRLPAGAELAIYSVDASDPASGVFRNGDPRFDPDRNVEFHDGAPARRGDFWTGTFFDERVRVEFLMPVAPAGAAASGELPFTVDRLQHLYLDPVAELAKRSGQAVGSCENDVTCHPEWADVARAVAGIGVVNRDALFCTGQLLDDQAEDLTPYWLTAHHCVSSAGAAQSAEIYWLYQTATCGGVPPALRGVPHSVGATLLATSQASDFSLLMVEGALPAGLFWVGWTSQAVADGTTAAAIHHPRGDYKRISFGFKDAVAACKSLSPNHSLVRVSWTDGPTETGSSGSGIFRSDTHQLFGQLYDGPSACGRETYDCFGAFTTTYPAIESFLQAGSDDDSEPNDTCAQARTVRRGTLPNRIVKIGSPDWYAIRVPAGKTVTVRLAFSNAQGDIDLAGFRSCSGDPAVISAGSSDGEVISLANPGGQAAFVYWRVYLDSDTRNDYDMTVSVR